MVEVRVGLGYDVHKFEKGRKLILGGVEIPHDKGLAGHSDADVLIHALIDAILGAAGLGDIGEHFPDTEIAYKDIDSSLLLKKVLAIIENKFRVNNVDCIIVAQRPKLSPYKEQIRIKLSELLKIEKERINVKAKTEEGLGFTGRQEGIKAYVIVSLEELGVDIKK
ncbi:2-C-methyl-D-erythritol 2,4-cyclodiphosphate synthase [Thermoanaerobacter thermohydrosulfuricus]|uniref:2-C-methyl-D-erythritol 2,4-cyclodiphosphate synthase n=2 Tax=Thermoanaerobacter thermohydrosulfuricus TaxID=1516 RepID=M8CLD7_THETY|nr:MULTISPECIES: 2-C-methyl-D-erythritol 2,4-cyclodiphosphate synthase [Thermoanaerobacter]EMT38040.1 2-C-methyl-D-erythritol 2,4-cyclodiphosphate synthase [Thermoanaerobacter thermohydrosulfuricus WC1]UZQ82605.1 2-C-methyl-D-erythritol 2,4-cyclodiphosphate synthase [Thermoanaerobacter sp. RKWS2]SDG40555.1 2-C-methyl-D-erythritol 2,4-cyclodiphosphate synthase [Thermoanaerobacter thermohydrosulfuricus]